MTKEQAQASLDQFNAYVDANVACGLSARLIKLMHKETIESIAGEDKEAAKPILSDYPPVRDHKPEKGTYLYFVKSLWQRQKDREVKEKLAMLYDHLNALYIEKRIYQNDN